MQEKEKSDGRKQFILKAVDNKSLPEVQIFGTDVRVSTYEREWSYQSSVRWWSASLEFESVESFPFELKDCCFLVYWGTLDSVQLLLLFFWYSWPLASVLFLLERVTSILQHLYSALQYFNIRAQFPTKMFKFNNIIAVWVTFSIAPLALLDLPCRTSRRLNLDLGFPSLCVVGPAWTTGL